VRFIEDHSAMTHRSAWAGQVGETDRDTIFGLKGAVSELEETSSPVPRLGARREQIVTRFKRDGNRIDTSRYSETGALISRDEFTYDSEGRRAGPRFRLGPDERVDRYLKFTYDETGRRRASQKQYAANDELVFTLMFSYDELGRRVKMEWVRPGGTLFRTYELQYDGIGNRVGVLSRDGAGQTEWHSRSSVDDAGRITSQVRFEHHFPTSIEQWRYIAIDEFGNWTRAIRWRLELVRRFFPLPTRTRIERRLKYFSSGEGHAD